jgi:hypothetical protein
MPPFQTALRRTGRAATAAGLLWLAGAAVPAAAGQGPVEPPGSPGADVGRLMLPESEPAFDLSRAEAWRDAVLPVVERVTGRTFTEPPPIRIVDREQLLDSMIADGLLQMAAIDPMADLARSELELTLDLLIVAPTLLGRYGLADREILLAAGNARPLMEAAGLAAEELDAVMTLTVAHELAHALHLQEIDLAAQLDAARTPDGLKAWSATLEGFGMLVQQRVAAELGLDGQNDRLVSLMGLERAAVPVAVVARRRYREMYEAGWTFLRAVAGDDIERAWAVLHAPPPVYDQVRRPERYGEPVELTIDPKRLFRGFRTLLADASWNEGVTTTSPEDVARTYRSMGEEAAEAVLAAVGAAHTIVLSDRSGRIPRVRSVTLFELTDPARGLVLLERVGALRDSQFAQLRTLGSGSELSTEESESESIAGVDAERARVYRIALRSQRAAADAPALIEMVLALVWRDNRVVQLVATGDRLDDDRIAAAVNELLARADSGAGLVPVVAPDPDDPLMVAVRRIEPLLDGAGWRVDYQAVSRAVAARLAGDDVLGRIIIETAFVGGYSVFADREQGDEQMPGPSVFVTLLELAEEDAAATLAAPLLDGAELLLGQMRQLMGFSVEQRDEPDLVLAPGLVARGRSATIALGDGSSGTMTVRVAHRGRFVIQVVDFFGGIGEAAIARLLRDVFDAVQQRADAAG